MIAGTSSTASRVVRKPSSGTPSVSRSVTAAVNVTAETEP